MAEICGRMTKVGKPCRYAAGWGVKGVKTGPCRNHLEVVDPRSLSYKHELFIEEYLKDLSPSKAAERAGFPDPEYGHHLLLLPKIKVAVSRGMREKLQRVQLEQDDIMHELMSIAFADIRGMFEWDAESAQFIPSRDLTPEQAAAIQSIETETTFIYAGSGQDRLRVGEKVQLKMKLWNKLSALKEIRAHLGVPDKHEITGKDGGPIEFMDRDAMVRSLLSRVGGLADRLGHPTTTSKNGDGGTG